MNPSRNVGFRKRPFGHQIVDRRLLPRIEQFITHGCRGRVPDAEEISDYLCMMYPEYRRKKRNWFVSSVVKALGVIRRNSTNEETRLQLLEQQHLSRNISYEGGFIRENDDITNNLSSSESDIEILETKEPLMEVKDSNSINRSMHEMYSRNSRESFGGSSTSTTTTTKLSNSTQLGHKESDSNEVDSSVTSKRNNESNSNGQMKDNATTSDSHVNGKIETHLQHSNVTDAIPREHEFRQPDSFIEIIDVPASPPEAKAQYSKGADTPVSKAITEQKESSVKRKGTKRKMDTQPREEENVVIPSSTSDVTFKDIGGCEGCLEEISKLILHMKHPEVFHQLGVQPPRGFLLHGPPGCGKTLLANAIAGELGLPFYKVAATEMVSGVSGESEEKIRNLFQEAKTRSPSILFIDEIDAITPKRETASREMERRIVAQLLFCLDDLVNSEAHVLVIGATNRPDSLDPALRRAGRFDREICMGIPDRNARAKILKIQCKSLRLGETFDYHEIAMLTPGFVGADLMALTREAAMCAVDRVFKEIKSEMKSVGEATVMETDNPSDVDREKAPPKDENCPDNDEIWSKMKDEPPLTKEQLENMFIELQDFKVALPMVQPSAKREGFATIPDVSWNDIGALEDIKEELSMAVLAPVKNQEQFDALGLTSPPGILLAGPPGCGKTLLAKAVANEAGINFISVKGPELLNMYVGESERAVRQVFQRARNSAPCVIFFDEIDALCPKRSDMAESSASSRVVNQLLTEMDGLEVRKQVFLMGATNRPDIIDPAVLRPGRLDKKLYVGLPKEEDRCKILSKITKDGTKPNLGEDVDLTSISKDERCTGFSGADLAALVREASTNALREYFAKSDDSAKTDITVTGTHFDTAFSKVRPSVSEKDQKWYQKIVDISS